MVSHHCVPCWQEVIFQITLFFAKRFLELSHINRMIKPLIMLLWNIMPTPDSSFCLKQKLLRISSGNPCFVNVSVLELKKVFPIFLRSLIEFICFWFCICFSIFKICIIHIMHSFIKCSKLIASPTIDCF